MSGQSLRLSGRRLGLLAAAILLLALVVRVWEVQRTIPYRPINDGQSYLTLAGQVAHQGDYRTTHAPGTGAGGTIGPTAYFPPAYPYFLAAVDLIDGDTTSGGQAIHAARLATAVLGVVAVGLIGLLALEAFGLEVALLAMLIGAVYPPLVELAGTPYSENLLIVFELAAVWAALRARRALNPYPLLAAAGVFTGLTTLTHQNGVLIVLPLIVCAIQIARRRRASVDRPALHTLAAPAILIACTILTVAPWTIRNAIVLHRFIPVTDENGITLAGTYNPTSASNPQIPYRWIYFGGIPADAGIAHDAAHLTEPALSNRLVTAALHYIRHHPSAPLLAAYHNLRRLLELEGSTAWRTSTASIGITGGTARIGVYGFWIIAALALVGLFTRLARRAPWWLWAVPILLALSVIFVNAETPRFRAPIDPYVIMLAACALVAVGGRVLAFRRERSVAA